MVDGLRALMRDLNFAVQVDSVPITVFRPLLDETPIATRGIWVTPITEGFPAGGDFQRQEPRRVIALRRDEVPSVPRGTVIVAPESAGAADQRWRVDGTERVEADHVRVVVVPEPDRP